MKIKFILLTIVFFCSFAFASYLDESIKLYRSDADNLFLAALSAISTNPNYAISEIQSKNGYILFLDGSKYYLLTLTKRYKNQTEIKILPQNSEFQKGSEVARHIFSLIDEELKNPLELVR